MKFVDMHVAGKRMTFFWCPGCDHAHAVDDRWSQSGDDDTKRISPSILSTAEDLRCHLFVRKGKLCFLDDCSHDLAGKIADVPEWPFGDSQ